MLNHGKGLVGLCAAVLLASAARAAPASPTGKCVLEKVGEIALEGDRYRPVITAMADGKPLRMLIDTGSAYTMLFPQAVAKLGLSTRIVPNLRFYGIGGGSVGRSAFIDSLSFAGISGRNMTLLVTGEHSFDVDGVIGANFLLQTDVEFDLANRMLRFFRSPGCRGDQVVYWNTPYSVAPLIRPWDSRLDVQVTVNGTPARARLDTGSSRSMLIPEVATRAGLSLTSSAVKSAGVTRGIGSQYVPVSLGRFKSFAFGDEVIHNASLRIGDMFHADTEEEFGSRLARPVAQDDQMLLGADFFHAHRVYVAEKQGRIYVSYVGGPVFDIEPASGPEKQPPP